MDALPSIAVDSSGIFYLANTKAHHLLMYRRSALQPLLVYRNLLVRQLQLDDQDNLYALITPSAAVEQPRVIMYRARTGGIIQTFRFVSGVFPKVITIVSPQPKL